MRHRPVLTTAERLGSDHPHYADEEAEAGEFEFKAHRWSLVASGPEARPLRGCRGGAGGTRGLSCPPEEPPSLQCSPRPPTCPS